MDANRFYSVPWDGYNDIGMKKLRRKHGGVAAYGRWHVLLGILYDAGGRVELDEDTMVLLQDELEIENQAELNAFIDDLAGLDWISRELLDMGVMVSKGVCDQLEYRKSASYYGKKGAEKRWGKKK